MSHHNGCCCHRHPALPHASEEYKACACWPWIAPVLACVSPPRVCRGCTFTAAAATEPPCLHCPCDGVKAPLYPHPLPPTPTPTQPPPTLTLLLQPHPRTLSQPSCSRTRATGQQQQQAARRRHRCAAAASTAMQMVRPCCCQTPLQSPTATHKPRTTPHSPPITPQAPSSSSTQGCRGPLRPSSSSGSGSSARSCSGCAGGL
jgi:hypothetical protein